jgi:hypothetical protein
MQVPQIAPSRSDCRQGCRASELAELRRHLARPSWLDDGHRQRLSKLAGRLARVRALGDEYSAYVELSPEVTRAIENRVATT